MRVVSCRPFSRVFAASILLLSIHTTTAFALPPQLPIPDESETPTDNGPLDFTAGISRSGAALGSMGGIRPWLSQYGVSFGVQETSEILGNVTGGIHQSADYDGLTQMTVQADTQRAFGFYGGTFNVSALNVHGRSLSADNLATLQTASGIEADRSTRLWELWYDQKFLDEDRLDVKIGQQSLDQEFMVSTNALLFVNTMFGWPVLPSVDLPGGGPAYPLSAPGIRFREKPINSVTILAGLFSGSPSPSNTGDPQVANASGTSFPINTGALAMAEIQYAYPSLGAMVSPDDTHPLAGTYKLGFWYDTESFDDLQYDNTGASLATSATGIPLQHKGDYAIYAVADQMLWRSDEDGEAEHTLNFFARAMGTPETSRNLVDFSLNAGLVLHEPFEHRDDDTFGIGMGFAHISNAVTSLNEAMTASGTYTPKQKSETYIETTYQYQVFPWLYLQPDFQYVFSPGAGVINASTGEKIKNEAVIGLRTIINF